MDFIAPKEESSYIKVIGVGGGGVNAVNHMCRQGIEGVDFIVCNTDSKSLSSSPVKNKLQLGEGLGAGGRPEVAEEYAQEAKDRIKEELAGTRMLFITAGMGGGTGTGASPVIAEIAKEIETNDPHMPEILVVAIVTMPFKFEGKARQEQAIEGLERLRPKVDSIIIIDNNKVFLGERTKVTQCFAKADDVLLTAAKSVAEMITVNSYMDVDLRDVNSVMSKSGSAIMGAGLASGENRAIEAVEEAMSSPLLNDIDITDSQKILVHITCSHEYEADNDEMDEIFEKITTTCKNSPNLKLGLGFDDSLGESMRVILVATGFQASGDSKTVIDEKQIKDFFDKQKQKLTLETEEPAKTTDNNTADTTNDFTFDVIEKQPETTAEPPVINQAPATTEVESKPQRVVLEMTDLEPSQTQAQTDTVVLEQEPVAAEFEVKPREHQTQVVTAQPQQEQTSASTASTPECHVPAKTTPLSHGQLQQPDPVHQDLQQEVYDRMSKIRKLKQQMSTPAGLSQYENIPAYQRQGMELNFGTETDSSKCVVDSNGNILPNSFIDNQVD